MGLFNKKKNADSSDSVLSESEIQKKLYGEFSSGVSHSVIGEREYLKERAPNPAPHQDAPAEIEPAHDLFSAPKDAWVEPDLPPRQTFSEQKTTDQAPRYVPLHDFEKKSVPPVTPVSGADTYGRFRYNQSSGNKTQAILNLGKNGFDKLQSLFETFLDPKQVALRRFIYWGAAILVVFLLFWGVNTLNSQREEAMRVRYKMPGKTPAVQVAAPVVPAPVVEREVTITPAPVRTKKAAASNAAGKASVPANGSYVIQVVTYPSKQDAEQVVAKFKQAGFHAFVQENSRPSGRVFYLVLIGGFHKAADAQAQLSKFRALEAARPFQDAFVRTNRS